MAGITKRERAIRYMMSFYQDIYTREFVESVVDVYLSGIRDSRLHDIGSMLIDKFGY